MENEFISALKNYANFSGRATRRQYLMFVLYDFLIIIGLIVLSVFVVKFTFALPLYFLLTFIPTISIRVRRMHDIGRSGWWIIVPIMNIIYLFYPSVSDEREIKKQSPFFIVLIVLLCLLPIIGILAAIAIPQYQNYAIKAQISDAVSVGNEAKWQVENYIARNRVLPQNLRQTGFSGSSKFADKIEFNPDTNSIEIDLNIPSLAGKKIYLTRVEDVDKSIWGCHSEGINPIFVPPNCKN